ncbi:CAP Gly-rich domain-containing protein [Kalaharituber pfeilii]|nr:CAP Gly-rich domain-containing protein [Kalaharituber pfeilii]
MFFQGTASDIVVRVSSDNSIAPERRISPSWSIALLKSKMEVVTGIPPSFQRLTLHLPHNSDPIPIDSPDEENTQVASFPFQPYAELHVADLRPPSARPNFVDTSAVEKYTMPDQKYEELQDTVLAWKKRQQLGRFDPNKPNLELEKLRKMQEEIDVRGIAVGKRCRVGGAALDRRGTVRYVGLVEQIPGEGLWVGIENDEPVGKNDGSISGHRYFHCKPKHGSFIRPDRVDIGDYPVLNFLEDMEEI